MNTCTSTGLVPLATSEAKERNGYHASETNGHLPTPLPAPPPDAETLRRVAWEVVERKPADSYSPAASHAGLAMVSPNQGFIHWRILPTWIDETARRKGNAWHQCRMIARLYDVSYIIFDGFNANRIQDLPIQSLNGQAFFKLPGPGTSQVVEVGFLLRSGEFVPAARSSVVQFAPDGFSPRTTRAGLLVNDRLRIEEVP